VGFVSGGGGGASAVPVALDVGVSVEHATEVDVLDAGEGKSGQDHDEADVDGGKDLLPVPVVEAAAPPPRLTPADDDPPGVPPMEYDVPHGGSPDLPELFNHLNQRVQEAIERLVDDGVCDRIDFDERALEFISGLPEAAAVSAVDDLARKDFSMVRNKPAFIMSTLKKVSPVASTQSPAPLLRSRSERVVHSPTVGSATAVPPSLLAHLPSAVADALQAVFASGVCAPSQFDDRAMDILMDLEEDDAVQALSEFTTMEPGIVRNPSAFWMGLAKKHKMMGVQRKKAGASYDGGLDRRQSTLPVGQHSRAVTQQQPLSSPSRLATLPSPTASLGNASAPFHTRVQERIENLTDQGILKPDDLDARALDALNRLKEEDGLSVLDGVAQLDAGRVRNMSALVTGLCKKQQSLSGNGFMGPPQRPFGIARAPPMAEAEDIEVSRASLDSRVREKFEGLIRSGELPENAFDARAMAAMAQMDPEDALDSLSELAASEPSRVRNISAYFMGLARKFSRGER